jgi:hypothetical protein
VRFENLTDVHTRRNAERVQHEVDGRAIFQVRHVFRRHDFRNHALVAVTSGHFVAGLHFAFNGDEDFNHLHDAGRQFVAALEFFDLVLETLFQVIDGFIECLRHTFDFRHALLVVDDDFAPQATLGLFQVRNFQLRRLS